MRAYIAVTAAYWAFMLTDGALRMLVLLHFHTLGFSPFQLAWLFVVYEAMGVVTNLSAGWIAARFGLASTLYAGLAVQVVALIGLAQLDPTWSIAASVIFVAAVQGASGVAKDLSKMSAKSAVRLLAPDTGNTLFRWVALLTGSKNAVKGAGFALGAILLATLGFTPSLWIMAAGLTVILIAVVLFLPAGLPRGLKGVKFAQVWSRDPAINALSLARLFLFGARDTWFVVGIPVFFYAVLSDGTEAGNRNTFFLIGSFMAAWIVLYGIVQATAPRLLRAQGQELSHIVMLARRWVWVLSAVIGALAGIALIAPAGLAIMIAVGLLIFGAVFALNSALHSYLILALGQAERVTMDVGFYYMANAAGRLIGTILSGISYQYGGLPLCLGTAALMAAASALSLRGLKTG